MDPPSYGYEYWRHYHNDCELVHVLWTDYCGILHEKLVPAESFNRMYRKHAYNLSDSDQVLPLTVSAASLTSLPDGKSAADEYYPSWRNCNLIPDYSTIQPCIDSKRRATVFARVEVGSEPLVDPREILKGVCQELGSGKEQEIHACLDFQFVLRNRSDEKVILPRVDGTAQDILQKLAEALRNHIHSANGPAIHSSDISDDGVFTIAIFMCDNVLEAVDNYYRMKRALQSITTSEGLRASFFLASDDTNIGVICKNKLRCRLHLRTGSGPQACHFAAGIMEAELDTCMNPSIYAFAKPNWLTYAAITTIRRLCQYEPEYITWGIRNSKTTINFPEGCEVGRLEFSDIDCMANMYLVVAAILILGTRKIESPNALENILQGGCMNSTNVRIDPVMDHSADCLVLADDVSQYEPATIGTRYDQIQRVPLCGTTACCNIRGSVRLQGTLIGEIGQAYSAVRSMEKESIMEAVYSGRVTSSCELLEKWY